MLRSLHKVYTKGLYKGRSVCYNYILGSFMQQLRDTDLSLPASPKKITRQLREVFREAFDHLGGSEWLVEFAGKNDQNARVFVQAISKLLPASAPEGDREKIVIDIPWLTRDRLSYKRADEQPMDADVVDLVPKLSKETENE